MCCNIYSRVTAGVIFTLIFLIPCILFNVGVGREWNKNAVKSSCLILDHIVIESKCSYDCNCKILYKTYDDDGQKITRCYTRCDVCWKICYDGYVEVFLDDFQTEVFGLTDDTIPLIESKLNDVYPINTTITCYHHNNVTKFSKEENMVYFGFYLFFTVVACSIALISLLYELYLKLL